MVRIKLNGFTKPRDMKSVNTTITRILPTKKLKYLATLRISYPNNLVSCTISDYVLALRS